MAETTEFFEIEHKYRADHVDPQKFSDWVNEKYGKMSIKVRKFAEGWDRFFRQGQHVVRHRRSTSGGQYNAITVKCRKDAKSTTDRVEVDVFLEPTVTDETVEQFLTMTGYKHEFSIFKKARIYFVDDTQAEVSLVIYDIHNAPDGPVVDRFIEVEVEKSSRVSPEQAVKILGGWDKTLREQFGLEAPLNQSLYEMYGTGKYRVVKQ